MILAEVKKVEVADFKIGDTEFKDVKLMGEMGCIRQYGTEKEYVLCIKPQIDFSEHIFSMLTQTIDSPEKLVVIFATGKFAVASGKAKSQLDKLKDVIEVQGSNYNWNYDEYNHGLYNGLALAMSIMDGDKEPNFRQAPKNWTCDVQGTPKPTLEGEYEGISRRR